MSEALVIAAVVYCAVVGAVVFDRWPRRPDNYERLSASLQVDGDMKRREQFRESVGITACAVGPILALGCGWIAALLID